MGIKQTVTECLVVTVFSTAPPPCFKGEKKPEPVVSVFFALR